MRVEREEFSSKLKFSVLKRLLIFLKPYRGLVLLSLLGLVLATAGDLITPVIVQRSMDQYILKAHGLSEFERLQGLKLWSSRFLLVLFLSLGANFIQVYFSAVAGQRVMKDIRSRLFGHLIRQSLGSLGDRPVGSLVSRVTSDVETVNELFTTVALSIMKNLSLMLGVLITLVILDIPLALITLATLPPVLILTLVMRHRIRDVHRETQHQTSRINAFLSESIAGMEILQLFGRRDWFRKEFAERNQSLFKIGMRQMYTNSFFRPVINLLSSVSLGFLIYYGASMNDNGTLTLGILIAFISLVGKFYEPIKDMADKIVILQSAMAGGERVFKMLDEDQSIADKGKEILTATSGELQFQGVHFRYKEEPVLQNMNFHVTPGETIAVVGTTGAGKTTLANLLTRFWDPQEGRILLDGRNIQSLSIKNLRSHIQTLQQDVTLFSGTLRDNISLGKEVMDEEILQALEKVKGATMLASLPQGLDTQLSEGASNISFGQRQLIAFARIFIFNPSIIIMDEATSNIDTETERWIQTAMDQLLEDRTAIIIAHRLSTIARADRILVLSHGQVAEEGSHQELLKRGGIYYQLHQLQYS
ncbi:MAG: ABC transporter ATP-binding protein [Spirochaetaceae bacterium]|jgi:ATP-binding cassette subfamily B multidrug efflux pump|nr:ABC transporter ATP-binding protein [Spirochaetaceae bacterium]